MGAANLGSVNIEAAVEEQLAVALAVDGSWENDAVIGDGMDSLRQFRSVGGSSQHDQTSFGGRSDPCLGYAVWIVLRFESRDVEGVLSWCDTQGLERLGAFGAG